MVSVKLQKQVTKGLVVSGCRQTLIAEVDLYLVRWTGRYISCIHRETRIYPVMVVELEVQGQGDQVRVGVMRN